MQMAVAPRPHIRLATIDGEIARDEAIDQVLAAASPAWKRAVHDLIYNLPEGWEGIFERDSFHGRSRWPLGAHARGVGRHRADRAAQPDASIQKPDSRRKNDRLAQPRTHVQGAGAHRIDADETRSVFVRRSRQPAARWPFHGEAALIASTKFNESGFRRRPAREP